MRNAILATTAIAVLTAAAPAAANSDPRPEPRCQMKTLRLKYDLNRDRAAATFGHEAVGRDIRRTGRCIELGRSVRTFRRWLNQSGASATSRDRTPTRSRTSPRSTGGLYSIPSYIVWRESRGSYFARNPSGAFGAYQLMPFHYGAGGECAGLGKDPAGQDACAAILWADGSQHWAATR